MNQVYKIINERIIELMENEGRLIWVKDWTGSRAGLPQNYVSKRPYTGINMLLLSSLPFSSPYYLTFNQVQQLGGQIKKGSKGIPVIFWKINRYETPTTAGDMEEKTAAMLRYYTVFNVEQCEGLKEPPTQPVKTFDTCGDDLAESIIENMPQKPVIHLTSEDRAYYSRLHDAVSVPEKKFFKSTAGYYSTMFHELGHATGHKNRLNRPELQSISFFGDVDYSKEELTAELTAAYVCASIGVSNEDSIKNSAAYIQGWKKKLREEPTVFIAASSKAQKAANFIMNIKETESEN